MFAQVSYIYNISVVCSQGRMAERSKAPDSRNCSVENSGTRMCAWVRIPLLSPAFLLYQICNAPLLALILVNKKFKCNQSCYSQFLALILVSKNHHILFSQVSHLNNFSIVCSQGRMDERSKAPDSRNISVENSGT